MNDQHSSRVPVVLFCSLVGMCLTVAALFFIAEPVGGHGAPHSTFARTMYKGHIGFDRLVDVRWLGLAFGLLQVMFFVVSLLLGTRQRGPLLVWFTIGGLLYAGTFIALVVAESMYARGGANDIVLGLPLPTAVMVYGIGGVPVIFSLLYVVQFNRWVLRPEDLQRINELVERRRRAPAETAD